MKLFHGTFSPFQRELDRVLKREMRFRSQCHRMYQLGLLFLVSCSFWCWSLMIGGGSRSSNLCSSNWQLASLCDCWNQPVNLRARLMEINTQSQHKVARNARKLDKDNKWTRLCIWIYICICNITVYWHSNNETQEQTTEIESKRSFV